MKQKRRNNPPAPPAPTSKPLKWFVAATATAALVLLMVLARDILGQLKDLGSQGGAASTRLLTGLFVVMCFAGFVAAALWAALKKALGRGEKK